MMFERIKHIPLRIKLFGLLSIFLFALLGLTLTATNTGINELEKELVYARLEQESDLFNNLLVQQELALKQTALTIRGNNDLITAISNNDRIKIQSVAISLKLRDDLDYLTILDSNLNSFLDNDPLDLTTIEDGLKLANLALVTIEDTDLWLTPDGWMLIAATYVGPPNKVDGVVIAGILLDESFLSTLNFNRQDPTIIIYDPYNQHLTTSTHNKPTITKDQFPLLDQIKTEFIIEVDPMNSALHGYSTFSVSEAPKLPYVIHLSTDSSDQIRRNISNRILITTILLSLLTTILLIYFINRYVISPITQLSYAAQEIGRGNFSTPSLPETDGTDEITVLIENFKKMVSRIRRSHKALEAQATMLEKRNQELEQFAYVTSHDLKAPLRAIASLTNWLEEDIEESLTPETKGYMSKIHSRINRMEELINGILAYSRVGRTKEIVESVSISELINEIVELIDVPKEFVIQQIGTLPTLETEKLKLHQIFINLLTNAIKYHDRADGLVEISAEMKGTMYEFIVSDNGPGIHPDFHEKIFVIFQTLQSRDTIESTGIGLAMVKKIVEDQGGSIWIVSDEGEGSAFHFTWPIKSQFLEQINDTQ